MVFMHAWHDSEGVKVKSKVTTKQETFFSSWEGEELLQVLNKNVLGGRKFITTLSLGDFHCSVTEL